MSDRFATETLDELTARVTAEVAATAATMPDPEPSAEAQLAALRTRAALTDAALAFNVTPRAVRYVTWHAERIFELQSGTLVPRHGERHPHDPCVPLDVLTWLAEFRRSEPHVFEAAVNH